MEKPLPKSSGNVEDFDLTKKDRGASADWVSSKEFLRNHIKRKQVEHDLKTDTRDPRFAGTYSISRYLLEHGDSIPKDHQLETVEPRHSDSDHSRNFAGTVTMAKRAQELFEQQEVDNRFAEGVRLNHEAIIHRGLLDIAEKQFESEKLLDRLVDSFIQIMDISDTKLGIDVPE